MPTSRISPNSKKRSACSAGSLDEAAPDAIVVVANDHLDNFFFDNLPSFAVATGPVAEGPFWYESEIMHLPSYRCAVHQELAQDFLRSGAENGIQFSQVHEFTIDHAFTLPLSYVRPEQDIPIVPIISNAFGYPIPNTRRWYALGELIGEVIRARPAGERIAVIGSFNLTVEVGGPKMGNYNQDFNRWVIEQMREGAKDNDSGIPFRTPADPRGKLDGGVSQLCYGPRGRGRPQARLHPPQAGTRCRHLPRGALEGRRLNSGRV